MVYQDIDNLVRALSLKVRHWTDLEGFQDDVDDTLWRQHVPAHYCRVLRGVQKWAGGDDYFNWVQAALGDKMICDNLGYFM